MWDRSADEESNRPYDNYIELIVNAKHRFRNFLESLRGPVENIGDTSKFNQPLINKRKSKAAFTNGLCVLENATKHGEFGGRRDTSGGIESVPIFLQR